MQYIKTLTFLLYVWPNYGLSSESTYIFNGADPIAEDYAEISFGNLNELTRLL